MQRTVQRSAQLRPQVLKAPVGSAAQHDAGGRVQRGKVAFERDVAGRHGDAGAHALKGAAAAVVPVRTRASMTSDSRQAPFLLLPVSSKTLCQAKLIWLGKVV